MLATSGIWVGFVTTVTDLQLLCTVVENVTLLRQVGLEGFL